MSVYANDVINFAHRELRTNPEPEDIEELRAQVRENLNHADLTIVITSGEIDGYLHRLASTIEKGKAKKSCTCGRIWK